MLRALLLAMASLILAGCGSALAFGPDAKPIVLWHIDEAFIAPYRSFETRVMQDPRLGRTVSGEPSTVSWGFVPQMTEGQTLAVCLFPDMNIVVGPAVANLSPEDVEEVIWHELTHCRYGLSAHDPSAHHIFSASMDFPAIDAYRSAATEQLIEYIQANGAQLEESL